MDNLEKFDTDKSNDIIYGQRCILGNENFFRYFEPYRYAKVTQKPSI